MEYRTTRKPASFSEYNGHIMQSRYNSQLVQLVQHASATI